MWAITSDSSPDFQKSMGEARLTPFACLAFPFATKLIYSAAAVVTASADSFADNRTRLPSRTRDQRLSRPLQAVGVRYGTVEEPRLME